MRNLVVVVDGKPLDLGRHCPFCGEPWGSESSCPPSGNTWNRSKMANVNNLHEVKCVQCDKLFSQVNPKQKYCSRQCYNLHLKNKYYQQRATA